MKDIPFVFRRRCYEIKEKKLISVIRMTVNIEAETEVYIGISAMSFIIDWGDGQADSAFCHRYEQGGEYQVTIVGAAIHALNLSKTFISELILGECIWLQHLICTYNKLEQLDVTGCINLMILDCSYNNRLTDLKLGQLGNLVMLDCSYNNLKFLLVNGCSELLYLYCAENNLTSLDLSSNRALREVDLGNNKMEAKQLEQCFNTLPLIPQQAIAGIMLDGNPGTFDCTFSVLKQKGWQIV